MLDERSTRALLLAEASPWGRRLGENPIRALLLLKEHRQGRELVSAVLTAAVGMGLLQSHPPGRDTMGLVVLLGCMWMMHLVVIPALVRPPDCTLLTTLRRGRCLEEIAGAGLPPARVVDTLAWHALTSGFSWMMLGLGLFALLPLLTTPSGEADRLRQVGLAVAWMLYPALRVVGSYAAQMLAAWTGESERVTAPQLLLTVFVHAIANVLLALGLTDLFFGGWAAGVLWSLAAMLWVALLARGFAIEGLGRTETRVRPDPVARKRPRMPAWLHPVLAREWLRDSVGLPGGAVGWVALNLLTLPILAVWLAGGGEALLAGSGTGMVLVYLPLLGLLVLGALRAASRTLDGCLAEREQRTIDLVATTRMSSAEWLDGLAMVGWLPRVAEVLLALAVLAPAWLASGVAPAAPLLLGLAVAAAMPLASYLAILCVPAGTSRREAAILAHLCLLGALWFGALMAFGLGAGEHPATATVVALVIVWMAAGVREVALRSKVQADR